MKLEILKWEDKTFDEIPEQDNPSFDYKYNADGYIIGRNNRCLIICKDENSQSKFINIHGRYVVFEVPTKPINAIRRGAFSKIKDAEIFAEALALKENN